MTPSPSETPYQSYYDALAAQGLLPVPEGSAEANKYAGIVGAVVGFLAVTLAVTIGVKTYKKHQLNKTVKKYKKTTQDPSTRDEESPATPLSQAANRTAITVLPNPLVKNSVQQLQMMDVFRTSHGPIQVHSTNSSRRLSVASVRNPVLSINKKDPVTNTLRPVLPKISRPAPTNRIKSIQFQQQQRLQRLAKEDDISTE